MLTQCDRDRAMNDAETHREREGRAQSRDGDRTLRQS